MVSAAPDSALPHPTTTTTEEASVVEEAIKRNTDCVYFLASPLTCKKGSDCEYRHSEYARVNPRDCWYWMTGNCLNPKCAFRHPPLDGLLGTQAAGLVGASIPDRQSSTVPVLRTPHDAGKQAVPCIFFQKGFCMKGVKCAFLHGISPASSKPLQSQGAGPSSAYSFPNRALSQAEGAGPSAVNSFPGKTVGGLNCSQVLPRGNPNSLKMTAIPVAPKPPVAKAETVFSVNGDDVEKNTPPPRATIYGFSTYRPPTTTFANGSSQGRISRVQQATNADDYSSYKEKEADDFLKESSPGFDVLVDDELGEADYYHCDDQFARSVGQEGKHLSSMEEYYLDHAEEYSSMSDLDREMFHNKRSPREYGWDQHHDFSPHRDGRAYFKGRSPSRLGESDLRYRLSKQRRVNGLRSVVNHDFDPESHSEDHSGHEALHSRQGSASSRLKGRIKFPGRSDATNGGHMYQEREPDTWGRNLSGGMYRGGRFGGRLRTRVNDDHNGGERNISGGSRARRELVNDEGADFAGPKSLAELKGMELPRKSLRSSVSVGCKASFEGPKPLSVHLKRKRGTEDLDNLGDFSLTKTDNPQDEEEQPQSGGAVEFEQTKDDVEIKDGVIMEEAYEDPEIDGDDQETGEYYEEQGEVGDYNYDESGNVHIVADGEEEYLDDDDGEEDFAKKVGVMFS